jgi:aminopeptidase N
MGNRIASLLAPAAWLTALLASGCAISGRTVKGPRAPSVLDLELGNPERRGRQAPLILDAITDAATGELLTVEELALRLGDARLVLVGESHTSADVHDAQERLIAALAAQGRRVVVGLEMFPHSKQEVLDDWVTGQLSEEEFVRSSRWYEHWGFSWRLYRDIFLRAQGAGIRMFGVNVPRPIVSTVRRKGIAGLAPDQAAQLPPRIDTDSPEHHRLFRAYFGEGDAAHAGLSEDDWERLFLAQCTWDAAMAWHAAMALESLADPQAVMVVIVGSGHVAYGLGIERQAKRFMQGKIASVIPVPVHDEDGAHVAVRASYANFLWGLPPEGPPRFPTLGLSLKDEEGRPHPVVTAVTPGGAAARAGVRPGDLVLSFDGTPVRAREDVLLPMTWKRWGDGVRLELSRESQRIHVRLPLRRLAADAS